MEIFGKLGGIGDAGFARYVRSKTLINSYIDQPLVQ